MLQYIYSVSTLAASNRFNTQNNAVYVKHNYRKKAKPTRFLKKQLHVVDHSIIHAHMSQKKHIFNFIFLNTIANTNTRTKTSKSAHTNKYRICHLKIDYLLLQTQGNQRQISNLLCTVLKAFVINEEKIELHVQLISQIKDSQLVSSVFLVNNI